MPLGWIDFSKNERNKVLSVLDLLSEAGTLDELGIAPVRDGFSDVFFPGTSTIQTRAKYFLIVPYTLKAIELRKETNPRQALQILDQIERHCAECLLTNGTDIEGVIGRRSLSQGKWVKRTPADIYWAGLRTYGISRFGGLSLTEYIRAVCKINGQKAALTSLGNRNDQAEENEKDDKDAGEAFHKQFWQIPTYKPGWIRTLQINLMADEGAFLKHQIISSCPNSMLAYILKNNMDIIMQCKSFQDLRSVMHLFPEQIQKDYDLAVSFSSFLYILRVLYNVIVSEEKNEEANDEWDQLRQKMPHIAAIDLDVIFERLLLHRNVSLRTFLRKAQNLMNAEDAEGLKTEIKRRERELKQNRAKTLHPGEFSTSAWFGGRELDYRFSNAKTIISDIFESEGLYVKS